MKPVMCSRLVLVVLCLMVVALDAQAGFFHFFHRKPVPRTRLELLQQQAAQRAKQKKPHVPQKYLFQQ